MASFNIHLAIAIKYLKKNNIKDIVSFFKGNIDPDLARDKEFSHYSKRNDKDNLEAYLSTKIGLINFIKSNKMNNDYEMGLFLHLVTDYIFFNYFFDKDYIKNTKYNDYTNDLYYSYDLINDYLEKEYNIIGILKDNKMYDYLEIIQIAKRNNKTKYKKIIDKDKLIEFIDNISNIDLDKYKEKLIKEGKNILP